MVLVILRLALLTVFLTLIALIAYPAFRILRKKGKSFDLCLEGQKTILTLPALDVATITAYSQSEFVIKAGDSEIESTDFNRSLHIGGGSMRSSGTIEGVGGNEISLKIETTGDATLIEYPSPDEKKSAISASIVALAILAYCMALLVYVR